MKNRLGKLKDGARFRINERINSAVYEVERKEKGRVLYSSLQSGRTYVGLKSKIVYPCN